jgi:hypothetical protein
VDAERACAPSFQTPASAAVPDDQRQKLNAPMAELSSWLSATHEQHHHHRKDDDRQCSPARSSLLIFERVECHVRWQAKLVSKARIYPAAHDNVDDKQRGHHRVLNDPASQLPDRLGAHHR